MSTLSTLEVQKQSCVNDIANKRNQITRCERAYESLNAFKRNVEASQASFVSVNTQKQKILESLTNISPVCRTAKKYSEGMEDTLSGIGMKAVGVTYEALVLSIRLKMSAYISNIDRYESEISSLERRISGLNREINALKQAAALAATQEGNS